MRCAYRAYLGLLGADLAIREISTWSWSESDSQTINKRRSKILILTKFPPYLSSPCQVWDEEIIPVFRNTLGLLRRVLVKVTPRHRTQPVAQLSCRCQDPKYHNVSSGHIVVQCEVLTGTRRNQKSELIVNQIKSCHQPWLAWPVIILVISKKTFTKTNLAKLWCNLFDVKEACLFPREG